MEGDTANSRPLFVPYVNRQPSQAERMIAEDAFITLHKSLTLINEYNTRVDMLTNLVNTNDFFFPKIPHLKLNNVIIILMPRLRWTNIIKKIFTGMEPPIQKQQNTEFYLNILIPEEQMTEQQKERVEYIKPTLSAAIWSHMLPKERLWVSASIHGMFLALDSLYTLTNDTIEEKNKKEAEDKQKMEELEASKKNTKRRKQNEAK